MRAFIAIDLPQSIKQAIGEIQATLQAKLQASLHPGPAKSSDVRWTQPEGIHLTLKFLGEVRDQQAKLVVESLRALPTFARFQLEVKGFGFFPDRRRPRVLWVGVASPPQLGWLAAEVVTAMERLGFGKENRTFTPHLTLARFGTPKQQPAIEAMLREIEHWTLGVMEVCGFSLYESRLLHGAPPEYRIVARFGDSS